MQTLRTEEKGRLETARSRSMIYTSGLSHQSLPPDFLASVKHKSVVQVLDLSMVFEDSDNFGAKAGAPPPLLEALFASHEHAFDLVSLVLLPISPDLNIPLQYVLGKRCTERSLLWRPINLFLDGLTSRDPSVMVLTLLVISKSFCPDADNSGAQHCLILLGSSPVLVQTLVIQGTEVSAS